jgi:hypothetical protein
MGLNISVIIGESRAERPLVAASGPGFHAGAQRSSHGV